MFRKRRPEADVDEIEPRGVETGVTVGGSSVFPIELSLAVAGALDRLSPDQREAVVLKIYQGFKFEEMAEILSCPVSTVKSRLYTALELLKAELAPVAHTRRIMSCSPFDLKDYFLQGACPTRRRSGGSARPECSSCREELDRLRLTEAALFALRDEEIPQRIAFVSDPVFEPSPWRRWLAAFWGSARGWVSSRPPCSQHRILVSALTRPAPAPAVGVPVSPVIVAASAARSGAGADPGGRR